MPDFIFDGPQHGPIFLFAHGAGADAESAFMAEIAKGLAESGIRVARFNFPYMQQRLVDGKKRPPNRAPALVDFYGSLIKDFNQPVFIGGKSMGGRIASMVAAQQDAELNHFIQGVVCLGYPFHPIGKPEKLRIEHLEDIKAPLMIAQGTRDKLGTQEEVASYALNKEVNWLWLEDGDHDFKPRVKSGFKQQSHLNTVINKIVSFIKPASNT
ncbi:alpha/beta family hydrolase [Psychrobium sp. 1_MG-2023]|uniref:alpha/beta family hydrolase n=1 Tax=Psychrobium sp. 1_MG-2023 TaxID=3062624 RepID=UPI000C342336|nr:alpha/beta family hydrolase [Psychrobium sp. 1_MG-2023]MDP2560967.1 dienelactone hydrolase family protein [Psychrobium sp. 1_MG-2023]PKF54944.1 alpha/beta hydrolase [Alteromonadales bacterium alter-6D02]